MAAFSETCWVTYIFCFCFTAGGVDEDTFLAMFEDVPKVHVSAQIFTHITFNQFHQVELTFIPF